MLRRAQHTQTSELYIKGFTRQAFVHLNGGGDDDDEWLSAQLWLDARWVTLINTAFFSEGDATQVRRWDKEARARLPVPCGIALKRYNKMMGATDHFNKELAKTHMQMGKCKQRFLRSLFLGWLFPAIGLVNVRTAFKEIVKHVWGEETLAKLQRARGVAGTTFAKWIQLRLGELLIEKGVAQASTATGGEEPHFMPSRREVHWERPRVLPAPNGYYKPHHPFSDAVNLALTPRKIPNGWDTKTKKPNAWLGGGRPVAEGGGRGRCEMCGVNAMRAGLHVHEHAHESRFACLDCRIILCRGCWDLYDHVNRRCPPAEAPPADASPQCKDGHVLNALTVSGKDLSCDECSADLSRIGMSFLSCSKCDYDVCIKCQPPSPAQERAQRAAAHSPSESPTLAEAEKVVVARRRPKAAARPSRYQKNRVQVSKAIDKAVRAGAASVKKRLGKRRSPSVAAMLEARKKQRASESGSTPRRQKRGASESNGATGGCNKRQKGR
jgi:hypothetical protein